MVGGRGRSTTGGGGPYGPEMNLSSASHYRGGRCSVGLPTLGLHWEANDFFHLLSGLGDRARRVTDDTKSGTRGLEKFLAPIYCAIAAGSVGVISYGLRASRSTVWGCTSKRPAIARI
jgi:hypothetical protein